MRTRQEIFTKVYTHLMKQQEKSIEDEACQYRTGELRCAIGCLIPDEKYSVKLEGRCVSTQNVLAAAGIAKDDVLFAGELQEIHDCSEVNDWHSALVNIAERYNLEVPNEVV